MNRVGAGWGKLRLPKNHVAHEDFGVVSTGYWLNLRQARFPLFLRHHHPHHLYIYSVFSEDYRQ